MKTHRLKILVPGIVAAAALALAVGVGAQTSPPPVAAPAVKSPQAAPMAGHPMHHSAAGANHDAGMKAECQAMMAKKQEMQDKFQAMDAALDKVVAEMNAAQESKEVDALEKPMVAVINELVAQRKASRSMMMEMQPAMMSHMMHMHGAKGATECPMMKAGNAPER
jgi:Skp family chaperone for outer membrane proteins